MNKEFSMKNHFTIYFVFIVFLPLDFRFWFVLRMES